MSEEGEVSMVRMCALWQHRVDARRRKLGNKGGKYWVDRSVYDGLCQHALALLTFSCGEKTMRLLLTVFSIVVCPLWSCIATVDPSGPTIMSTSSSMPDHVLHGGGVGCVNLERCLAMERVIMA